MTAVEQAIAEIDEALATFSPVQEGLRDYKRLNLVPATLAEVDASLVQYDRRIKALNTAREALAELVNDGHPLLAVREIDPSALGDLQDNAATIEAALKQFASNAAKTIQLDRGPTEPKKP